MLSLANREWISSGDLEVVTGLLQELGREAENQFRHHDFGFPKAVLRGHIVQVRRDLQRLRNLNQDSALPLERAVRFSAAKSGAEGVWNYRQTLRFAAGAILITERYRPRMSADNVPRSITAKILVECLAGILDDVVDFGPYSLKEARELYSHCFASLTRPRFEVRPFRNRLRKELKPESLEALDLITEIVAAFNLLHRESPNGHRLSSDIERAAERVAFAQSLTMLLKSPTMDLPLLMQSCARLSAPAEDLRWHEKLSSHVAHATLHNLVDMCFVNGPVSSGELRSMMAQWYYYDLEITHLNHLVGLDADLRSGIINLALLSMREFDLLGRKTLEGYTPELGPDDYAAQLARTAELARRGIAASAEVGGDPGVYQPFMAVMIPVVVLADWIGTRDELISEFLRELSPSIREAVKSLGPRREAGPELVRVA